MPTSLLKDKIKEIDNINKLDYINKISHTFLKQPKKAD